MNIGIHLLETRDHGIGASGGSQWSAFKESVP
jgi:hypothetical protein